MVPLVGAIEAINDGNYSSLAGIEILRLFLVMVQIKFCRIRFKICLSLRLNGLKVRLTLKKSV
jgi:hypothetical protein